MQRQQSKVNFEQMDAVAQTTSFKMEDLPNVRRAHVALKMDGAEKQTGTANVMDAKNFELWVGSSLKYPVDKED